MRPARFCFKASQGILIRHAKPYRYTPFRDSGGVQTQLVTWFSGVYSRIYRNVLASGGPPGTLPGPPQGALRGPLWGACGAQQTPEHQLIPCPVQLWVPLVLSRHGTARVIGISRVTYWRCPAGCTRRSIRGVVVYSIPGDISGGCFGVSNN